MHLRPFLSALALAALLLSACESGPETDRAASPSGIGKTTSNINSGKPAGGFNFGSSSSSDQPRESGVRQIEEDEASQALFSTADKMLKQGDVVSATILYRRAVNQDPESVPALRGLARLYEAQDRPREALESWRAIAAIDDKFAEAHRGMGRNLMTMKLYPKAIEALQKAHALGGEDDLKTMNLLAVAYLRSGQEEKAIDTLKEATSKSDDLDTRNNLGFAYIMAGQIGAAITVLEDVVLDSKATSQQRQNLALAYGLAGREEDARALALQDLPPKAVEKNLKSYREMRSQILGKPSSATRKLAKKKAPVTPPVEAVEGEVKEPAPKKEEAAAAPTAEKKEPVAAEKKEPAPVEKKPEPVPATATAPTPAPAPAVKKMEEPAPTSEDKPKIVIKPAPSLAAEPEPKPATDPTFMPAPKAAPVAPVGGMSMPPQEKNY
jgi:Flp pilus assembly protein TadD